MAEKRYLLIRTENISLPETYVHWYRTAEDARNDMLAGFEQAKYEARALYPGMPENEISASLSDTKASFDPGKGRYSACRWQITETDEEGDYALISGNDRKDGVRAEIFRTQTDASVAMYLNWNKNKTESRVKNICGTVTAFAEAVDGTKLYWDVCRIETG